MIPLGLRLDDLLGVRPGDPNYREQLSIPPADVVIGFIGRMVPIKALPTLVAAFARALKARADMWLVLCGDGPVRIEVEALAIRLGISERVRFLGWTEDLPRVYATMDICALASLNEGTPVAIIEALAAGRAVVATRVGGVPDVIDHGATGLLVPAADEAALAAAIVTVAADGELRRRMGAAGRRQVAERYTAERLVSDVEQLYVSALAEKRRFVPTDTAAIGRAAVGS
jgi:glycosyltransferase involved in cell wall biosynthesis